MFARSASIESGAQPVNSFEFASGFIGGAVAQGFNH
jgi:hypothetical protein